MEEKLISIDHFKEIDLRVARIKSAERVENTDRLLRLLIQCGGEERQLVAGIGAVYGPEDLIGKSIVVIWNLEPAIIRGVESHGMLLAAKDSQSLALLTVDREILDGAKVG